MSQIIFNEIDIHLLPSIPPEYECLKFNLLECVIDHILNGDGILIHSANPYAFPTRNYGESLIEANGIPEDLIHLCGRFMTKEGGTASLHDTRAVLRRNGRCIDVRHERFRGEELPRALAELPPGT